MIDNFNTLSPWFDNLNQGDFYFVQIIQRKKECEINKNSNIIKNYIFYDKTSFLDAKDEITMMCKTFNARAYFWVNPRNCKQVQIEALKQLANSIECNNFNLYGIINKAIGVRKNNKYPKLWILDFDTQEWSIIHKYLKIVKKVVENEDFTYISIPTPNGVHILCEGFNVELFKQELVIEKLPQIDIHKDNCTVLYYGF